MLRSNVQSIVTMLTVLDGKPIRVHGPPGADTVDRTQTREMGR